MNFRGGRRVLGAALADANEVRLFSQVDDQRVVLDTGQEGLSILESTPVADEVYVAGLLAFVANPPDLIV